MHARCELDVIAKRSTVNVQPFKTAQSLLPPASGEAPVTPYDRAGRIIGKTASLLNQSRLLFQVCDVQHASDRQYSAASHS